MLYWNRLRPDFLTERANDSNPVAPETHAKHEPSFGALAVTVIGFLLLLAIWRALQFGAPYGGDWAQYMAHAKAIVEGRPYDDTGYIFSPSAWLIGPAIYPPGLPISLTPLVAFFGDSLVGPRLLMHGFLAAFLWSVYRYFARTGDRVLALGTVALLGTSFLLNDTGNVVGSDIGMCAFVWLAIAVADSSVRWSSRETVVLCLVGLLALSFRLAAAPLVPAIALWAMLRFRSVGMRPWIVAALWAAGLFAMLSAFGPGDQGSQAAAQRLIGPGGVVESGWDRGVSRMLARLTTYRFAVSNAFLYPFPFGWANGLYHISGLAMALVGIWGWLSRDWTRFGVVFGAGTFAMLLILPVWVPRYAWVLTPFACYGLVRGISLILQRGVGTTVTRASAMASTCALVLAVLAVVDLSGSRPAGLADDTQDWKALGPILANTSDVHEVRAASNRPRMLAWYTGVPAMGLPYASLDIFLEEARRLDVSRVVVSTERSREPEFAIWLGWKQDNPEVFKPIYAAGGLEIYEINDAPQPDPGAED